MGINTDLSQPPYFDDYSEEKQFNRVLFKPARAVQTRELNQLQAILQNQVERFGSNIYKEGTIISGVNITQLDDLYYVKVNDSADLVDPTVFLPSDGVRYFLTSQITGLKAEIIFAQNGFETRNPDLKTFFILYANTGLQEDGTEVKQFLRNEQLSITDNRGNEETFTATVANVANTVGRSFGVVCTEGVIYQKGHFIFVEDQFAVVSKYSSTPTDVSVGFNVNENIIDAGLDPSLYDNAQGFNNFVAPGADRLQLKPVLSVYPNGEQPEQFFTLIRYEEGQAIQIRNVTQFNSISTEMATRTFEESGDYVTRGMRASLEQETISGDTKTYVTISPGKAYVDGYAVETFAPKYLEVETSTAVATKTDQYTNVDFGGYLRFDASNGDALNRFINDGSVYEVYNASDVLIATTSIRHIEVDATGLGNIYVYNYTEMPYTSAIADRVIARLEDTPIIGNRLRGVSDSSAIYDMGKDGVFSAELTNYVRSTSQPFATTDDQATNFSKVISKRDGVTPIVDKSRVFGVDSVSRLRIPDSITREITGDMTVTFSPLDAPAEDAPIARVYYQEEVENLPPDTLGQATVVTRATVTNTQRDIPLGLPNVVELISVTEIKTDATEIDRTSEYKLYTNAKSNFYDYSFLAPNVNTEDRPSDWEDIKVDSIIYVESVALKRTSSVGQGYLSSDSFEGVSEKYILPFEDSRGNSYNPKTSVDFRPYARPIVPYAGSRNTAGFADRDTIADRLIVSGVQPARDTFIITNQEYYLSRFDSIVLDAQGEFSTIKGGAAEVPSNPNVKGRFELARVLVPGGENLSLTGNSPMRISNEAARNYTMKDIRNIDKRLSALTETVSLNLLEKKTDDLFIPNEFGQNRFKNGILVDNFKSFEVSDFEDAEYRAATDRNKGINMPAIKQFPLEMKLDEIGGRFSKFDSVITMPVTGDNASFINQPFATRSRNAVSNYYKYNASVFIDPEFDAGYNMTENPDVNLDIDLATPFTNFLEALQEFVPITSTAVSSVVTTSSWRRIPGRAPNGRPLRRISTTSTTTTTETGINVDAQESEQSVGSFVTDIAFQPFMRARQIRIVATGLRPNTKHHLFFNEELMDDFFIPGTIASGQAVTPRNVAQAGVANNGVRSDANGNLNAIFALPENKFYVGEGEIFITDVNQYEEKDSAATSFGRKTYRAYSFDIEKTALTATTRTPEFNAFNSVTTTNSVTTRVEWYDPLAQTFYVKKEAAQNADCLYFNEIDLYFRGQNETDITMADVTDKGVNIEIREVSNGFPTAVILPFGKKRLQPSEVFVSEDASVPTRITFDDPVRLNVEKEYAFVVRPDGNDPNYLVWTSKVGGRDATSGLAVTQDWGDGVLFTSTNNRAWKSYQDEDIKFNLKRVVFDGLNNGLVTYSPNAVEFFTISNNVGAFIGDEVVYKTTTVSVSGGIDGSWPDNSKLVLAGSAPILTGDRVLLTRGTEKFIADVVNSTTETNGTVSTPVLYLNTSPFWTASGSITVTLLKSGKASYFNARRPNKLYLYDASTRSGNYFEVGDTLIGYTSGATAVISSIDNIPLSYYQPNFYIDNSTNTRADLRMLRSTGSPVEITTGEDVYMIDEKRVVYSQSNIDSGAEGVPNSQDFKISIEMSNNNINTVTPIIDNDLKIINAYQYYISDQQSTSSRYVTKEVVLQDELDAVGLKVLLTAFRPNGTNIQTYARFKYSTSNESMSSWVELTPKSKNVYSNAANVQDYRDFEYNLDEERPSKTVNWSNLYDDIIGVVRGTITTGPIFDFINITVNGNPRCDVNENGNITEDDAILIRSYALGESIEETSRERIETAIEDYLLETLNPDIALDSDLAVFNRYVSTVSGDKEFSSFQVKLVYTNDIGVDINIFPHVRDFRAIALT